MWYVDGKHEKLHHSGVEDGLIHVCMSPDSCLVAASSYDKSIYVWDISSGSLTARFSSDSHCVYPLTFTLAGSHIISGSSDNSVRLWELDPTLQRSSDKDHFGGSLIQVYEGHAVCHVSIMVDTLIDLHEGCCFLSSNNS